MDYREEIIRMLMHVTNENDLGFICGATRGAYRHAKKKEESGSHTHPKLSRKMKMIQLLLEIDNDRFLKRIFVSLREYLKEKGGAA